MTAYAGGNVRRYAVKLVQRWGNANQMVDVYYYKQYNGTRNLSIRKEGGLLIL